MRSRARESLQHYVRKTLLKNDRVLAHRSRRSASTLHDLFVTPCKTRPPHQLGGSHRRGAGDSLLLRCDG